MARWAVVTKCYDNGADEVIVRKAVAQDGTGYFKHDKQCDTYVEVFETRAQAVEWAEQIRDE